MAAVESMTQDLRQLIDQHSVRLASVEGGVRSLADTCSEAQVRRTFLGLMQEFVGLQDFALSSAGAKVVTRLTSHGSRGRSQGWFNSQSRSSAPIPPDSVLSGNVLPGDCWGLPGPSGQLGISLPYPVILSHVTVDHVAKELVSDIERAPKLAILWGVIDGKNNEEKASRAAVSHPPEFRHFLSARHGPPITAGLSYLPLAYISYNIFNEYWVQKFPVIQGTGMLGIDFGVVVLEVLNNWGGNSTCLYRVRVHGEIAS
jgi:hypothetical protein